MAPVWDGIAQGRTRGTNEKERILEIFFFEINTFYSTNGLSDKIEMAAFF